MDIKDIKAHLRAEKEELEALSWFIRIPVKVGNFLRFRVWEYIVNFPYELKLEWQRFMRGYSDEDCLSLNSFIINKIRDPLNKFVKHEAEEGIVLPKEFETDPSAWLVVISKIKFSIDHTWREENELDYLPTQNMGVDEKEQFYKQVDEGFELFGRYLRNLWSE